MTPSLPPSGLLVRRAPALLGLLLLTTSAFGPCGNAPLGSVTIADGGVDHPDLDVRPIDVPADAAVPSDDTGPADAGGPSRADAAASSPDGSDDLAISDTAPPGEDGAPLLGDNGDAAIALSCEQLAACAAGQECLCCPLAGRIARCTCSVSCLHDSDCPSATPKCNVRTISGIPIGRGLCTSPSFYCCWNCL